MKAQLARSLRGKELRGQAASWDEGPGHDPPTTQPQSMRAEVPKAIIQTHLSIPQELETQPHRQIKSLKSWLEAHQ
jgi:hypothetical protein